MANAVARLRIDHAILLSHRLQIVVVVCIFEADLHGIVVHIADGHFGLCTVKAHAFELKIGHCAGRILR